MSRSAVADRVASRFQSPFLRGYVRSKLAIDPLYPAVARLLHAHELPILDIGCGVGLMELYLRESGVTQRMLGVDHDESKTREANRIAAGDPMMIFETGDARRSFGEGATVLLLDVLHYLADEEQRDLLGRVADAVPPGGVAIIRDAIRDRSWRFRATFAAEVFARGIRWLKVERLNFPSREGIVEPFRERGFDVRVEPLWGSTPFNNYLFVFSRPGAGTTKL